MRESAFTNEAIDTDHLPQIDDVDMQPLAIGQRTIEYWYVAIFIAILVVIATVVLVLVSEPLWVTLLVIGVLVLLAIFSFLYVRTHFRTVGWALREHDVLFEEGVFWKSRMAVPFNRIQHAEVHQNPIERRWQLGRLKIYTAGGSSSDVSIYGLPIAKADGMKSYILAKIVKHEEE